MTLRLTVVSYRGQRPAHPVTAMFGPSGGSIGRGADCTWILPDEYEIVSRRHCRISWTSGRYWITDTASKNGFAINDGGRVERDTPVALATGDRLTIGDYVIEARVEVVETPSVAPGDDRALYESPPFDRQAVTERPVSVASDGGGFIEPLFGGAPPSIGPITQPGADWLDSPEPDTAPIAQHMVHIARPVTASITPMTDLPLNWNPFDEDGSEDAATALPQPVVDPLPPSPHPVELQTAAGAGPDHLWRAFLEGAGLPAESLAGMVPEDALRIAGQRLRALTAGVRELLIARAQVKNELRVAHSVIGSSPTNPLKMSSDERQSLAALLAPRQHHQDGERAVAEAFRDLKQHEFALLSGARSAVASAVAHFDPATLSKRLANGTQGSLGSLMPMARKARYWELFEAEFRRVADEAEEDAHGPLARALARAYEEQNKKC
jgi:type VI secretion system FHA domain protein